MGKIGSYWKRVFVRAFKDTFALLPFARDPKKAAFNSAIAVGTIVGFYFILGEAQMMEHLNTFVVILIVTTIVFTAASLLQLIAAPAKIEEDNLKDYERKTRKDKKLLAKLLKDSERKIELSAEKRKSPYTKTFPNFTGEYQLYFAVRVFVENKSQIDRLKNFRVQVDRINNERTNIPLKEDTDEEFCPDLAPGEERHYIVASTEIEKKGARAKLDKSKPFEKDYYENRSGEKVFVGFKQGGKHFSREGFSGDGFHVGPYAGAKTEDKYEYLPPAKLKLRITATSLNSPKESLWFELFLTKDEELILNTLTF